MDQESTSSHSPVSVSFLSGKGGVGKTNLAAGVALALGLGGKRTLLVDWDAGLANLEVVLGVQPRHSWLDVMGGMPPFDACEPLAGGLVQFLSAPTGRASWDDYPPEARLELLEGLGSLREEIDYAVMDLGAGIGEHVLEIARSSQWRVVVITPEPASLADAYAVIKVLAQEFAVKDFLVAVNQVTSWKEAHETFTRLADACVHFLSFKPELLGAVHHDVTLLKAVRARKPVLLAEPHAQASRDIAKLAENLEARRQCLALGLRHQPLFRLPAQSLLTSEESFRQNADMNG